MRYGLYGCVASRILCNKHAFVNCQTTIYKTPLKDSSLVLYIKIVKATRVASYSLGFKSGKYIN